MNGKQFEEVFKNWWNSNNEQTLMRVPNTYKPYARYWTHKVRISKKLAVLYGVLKNKNEYKKWFSMIKRGLEDYRPHYRASYPDFILTENGRPIAFVEVKYGKHLINISQLVFQLMLAKYYNIDYYIATNDGLYKPWGHLVKIDPTMWDTSLLPTLKFDFTDGKIKNWEVV